MRSSAVQDLLILRQRQNAEGDSNGASELSRMCDVFLFRPNLCCIELREPSSL